MEKNSEPEERRDGTKRVLVLYYSQTGQLERGVRSMMRPLEGVPGVEVVYERLEPEVEYPFPWPVLDFMDVFPESVHMDPPRMKPVTFDPDGSYDLVVLAYQVWFLSPSLPITGFLKSEAARVLKDKPVITFIACRNMWLTAHEKMRVILKELGANHIDNAVLVDQGPPWATFITTPRWLLSGRKDGFWGVFPPAGVKGADIVNASRFGRAIADSLDVLDEEPGRSLLSGLGAVKVNPRYIASEKIGHRSFALWGRLFRLLGRQGSWQRKPLAVLYLVILVCLILTVVPVTIVVRAVIYPFLRGRLDSAAKRFEEPSGSSVERMAWELSIKPLTHTTKQEVNLKEVVK